MDKYNRSNFYETNVVDNILEADIVMNYFDLFKIKKDVTYHVVSGMDLKRPDNISFRYYRKVNYYWIIMKVNNLEDPFNDLHENQVIIIPDPTDIEDFYQLVRKKLQS
jgi:hypothetical protein